MPRTDETPKNKQYKVMAGKIGDRFADEIQDKGTFDVAYNDFLDGELQGKRNTQMRERVFSAYI